MISIKEREDEINATLLAYTPSYDLVSPVDIILPVRKPFCFLNSLTRRGLMIENI